MSEHTEGRPMTDDSALLTELIARFLSWELPKTVSSDLCVTDRSYPHSRFGTSLLTADEARKMIEHLFAHPMLRQLERDRAELIEAVQRARASFVSAYLRGAEIANHEKRGSRAALAGLEMQRYAESGQRDVDALLGRLAPKEPANG